MRVTLTQGLVWLEAPPRPAPCADESLVEDARAGDAGAQRALYRLHGPGIRRFLGDLLRDPALADDATQETFARVFSGLHRLSEPAKLQSWLFGVARNVSLELRKVRARQARIFASGVEAEGEPSLRTPEGELLGREAAEILVEALGRLPEGKRAALLLRVDHQLAYTEIAEALGWSVAKAKVEVHRARLSLRELLEQRGECP